MPAGSADIDLTTPVSVLLIEDDPVDEMAAIRAVTASKLPYRIAVARSVAEARQLLAAHSFDIILSDHHLPDGIAFDLLEALVDRVMIITTGAGDEMIAAQALRLGIHDYLIKDPQGDYLKLLPYRMQLALQKMRMSRNLHEQKEQMNQFAERLSLATRAGGVGIWDWDVAQDVLTWDEQMYVLYGITRDYFGGAYAAWRAGVHPDDQSQADAEIQMALRGEKDFNTEFRISWPDGTIRSICALGSVRRDASGQPVRMIGTNWDITERKVTEAEILALNENLERLVTERTKELLVSEARLRSLFEQAAVGVAEIDTATGRFLRVNRKYTEIVGYLMEEILAFDFMVLTHPDDLASDLAQMERLQRGELREFTLEKRYLRKDGSAIWVHLAVSALWVQGETPNRHMAVVQDITERRQAQARVLAERELQARNAAMRELVAHVEQRREEDRKYIAREIHDELGQLLAALRMETSLLKGKGDTDSAKMEMVRRNMMELIDKAIGAMRDVAVNLRPASLELGIVTAIEKLRTEFTKHTGIKCMLQLMEDMPNLDEDQTIAVFRIVQESLTNVLRHAEASSIEIALKQSAGDFIIEVRDNGKGFDSASIAKQRSFGLLGMRERVAAMGGSIEIASIPKHGTIVGVCMPIKRNQQK